MIKQSIPTKVFAWLACVSGGVGTGALLFALLTGAWFSLRNQNQAPGQLLVLPAFVFGLLGYGLALSVVTLSTGIAILRRSRHALLLVVATTLWSIANLAMWSRLYNARLTILSPRLALAILFLVWMILRRHELQRGETQPQPAP